MDSKQKEQKGKPYKIEFLIIDKTENVAHETTKPERGRVTYIPEEEEETYELVFHRGTPAGINFSKFSNVAAKVTGEDLPSGIDSFDPARWRSIILANIKKSGYTQPTSVQKWAVPVIMKKGDLMACAETASGKTTSS
ncbi:hypothetical protein QYM36_017075 [Artemia franciscana]|uniref:RNA helicase n=1 Tax=Artemia franciscana TaxID=6661 RepID=A0AA88KWK9_ARTSF|nr:hypothetical protein QYM36_017075 [Artemia franciscana]